MKPTPDTVKNVRFIWSFQKRNISLSGVVKNVFKMHPAGRWKFYRRVLKFKPMSNAEILSRSQLWADVFGEQPRTITAFVFRWQSRPDGPDKFVLVHGESEAHALGLATTKLEGIVGHSGFVLGEKIEVV